MPECCYLVGPGGGAGAGSLWGVEHVPAAAGSRAPHAVGRGPPPHTPPAPGPKHARARGRRQVEGGTHSKSSAEIPGLQLARPRREGAAGWRGSPPLSDVLLPAMLLRHKGGTHESLAHSTPTPK